MSYRRVIPRDLFNESKLLKCLGQLSLLIHNGVRWPQLEISYCPEDTGEGFAIEQDPSDGGLFCPNVTLRFARGMIDVKTCLNAKTPYPLVFTDHEGGEAPVFNDDGALSAEFEACLDHLTLRLGKSAGETSATN